jgi:hypothetical protein
VGYEACTQFEEEDGSNDDEITGSKQGTIRAILNNAVAASTAPVPVDKLAEIVLQVHVSHQPQRTLLLAWGCARQQRGVLYWIVRVE